MKKKIAETKEKKPAKKKKKKANYYFGIEVQNKIVEYQKCDSFEEKEKIYVSEIQNAFKELVHNLVSVYGFKSSNEDLNHLKHDCVTFLYETIGKWSPEKGTKAFSYFNVVAKNWLTINSRRLLKNARRSVNIDDQEAMTMQEKNKLNEIDYFECPEEEIVRNDNYNEMIKMIDYVIDSLKDENDIKCAHAIRHTFVNIDSLDYLNKRAVFVYLREISGLNSSELSSSLTSIRKIYKKVVGPDKQFSFW